MTMGTARKRIGIGAAALALSCAGFSSVAVASDGAGGNAQAKAAPSVSTKQVSAKAAKCPYPYVCFSKGGKRTGMFKDTGYWQNLGASNGASTLINTRKDDVAYVKFSNTSKTWCAKPGHRTTFNSWKPSKIYISTAAKCKKGTVS